MRTPFAQIDLAPIHWLFLGIAAVAAVMFFVWIIAAGVAKGVKDAQRGGTAPPRDPPAAGGFPVEVNDGPGTFRVTGVDQRTAADVTEHIPADSTANAKVKAELRGIVVTRIDRV